MAEVGQKLYLGNEPITLIQNNGFVYSNPFSESPFDPDAQAFLTATGITDPTISSAINTLVVDLKDDNVWNSIMALWPFVGGTATTHKYNLVDPQDTDAAYRLTFGGTWTHDANGATPNGAGGTYANTYLSPTDSPLSATNGFMYYYCPANYAAGQFVDIGSGTYSPTGESTLVTRWVDNNAYFIWYNSSGTPGFFSTSNATTTGHLMVNKVSTGVQGWKNGVKIGTSATNGLTTRDLDLYLAAENNGTTSFRNSPRRHATTAVGEGLTDAQGLALYNAISAFNTTLGR